MKMQEHEIEKKIRSISADQYMEIIKLARAAKKNSAKKADIKVAVIGTCSLQYFVMVLKVILLKYGISAEIYEGQYDGINMEVFDRASALYCFQPDVVIVLSDYRDIKEFPSLFDTNDAVYSYIKKNGEYYSEMWDRLSEIKGCHILQANLVTPVERVLGNLESGVYYSRRIFYQLLNIEMTKRKRKNVTIIDMEYLASIAGKDKWFDRKSYFMNKLPFSLEQIGIVCDVFAQQIAELKGKIKKCLVLDLDNTLWGGVVADEGPLGIQTDPNQAEGEAYLEFQKYILELKNRGVILGVISKNDYETAKEPFDKNENMILKYDDFSAFIANWENKAKNIEAMANELNIGTDSFVFFDDNPAEREIVKMYHPEVTVIEVPENIAEYVTALERAHPFDWLNITKEDISRTESYVSNSARKTLQIQFKDYQEYLKALEMESEVGPLDKNNLERFTQLINKSNQFNLRTQRYSEGTISQMTSSPDYRLLTVKLSDKFSKFGIISCIILKKEESECFIDTWVMSCRVLKRDVEKLVFNHIVKEAVNWKCERITGEYIPTVKNKLVKNLLPELGFELIETDDTGKERYSCSVELAKYNKTMIKER